jgi:hypothetical protein
LQIDVLFLVHLLIILFEPSWIFSHSKYTITYGL